MAIFPDALDNAFGARFNLPDVRSPASSRRGLTARMNALVRVHGGSSTQAAASAGIPIRTWRDWRNGTHPPSARGLRRLEGAYARQIIAPAAARLLASGRKAVSGIHVTATVIVDPKGARYTNSTPYRVFRAEKIDTGKVMTAWMHGGGDRAAAVYEAEVHAAYGSVFAFEGDRVSVDLLPDA